MRISVEKIFKISRWDVRIQMIEKIFRKVYYYADEVIIIT